MNAQLSCPHRGGPILIPDDHRNQPIQCPHRGQNSRHTGQAVDDQRIVTAIPEPPADVVIKDRPDQSTTRHRITGPAIGLIVTGAMAAAIAVIVPWYCRLLGLVVGIWALVVLYDNKATHVFT